MQHNLKKYVPGFPKILYIFVYFLYSQGWIVIPYFFCVRSKLLKFLSSTKDNKQIAICLQVFFEHVCILRTRIFPQLMKWIWKWFHWKSTNFTFYTCFLIPKMFNTLINASICTVRWWRVIYRPELQLSALVSKIDN